MQEVHVEFVKKESRYVAPMVLVPPKRKAVRFQAANAGQSQKKEQDVPVIKSLEATAGSMADEPWARLRVAPLLWFCKVVKQYSPEVIP